MTIREMQEVLDAKFLYGEELEDLDVEFVFSADMMSDVLAYGSKCSVLIYRSVQSPGRPHRGDAGHCLYHFCPGENA